MTTTLGSYLDTRWWMRLITLFWCLGILRVNFFAIFMLLVLHGLTPWPKMLNILKSRCLGFMSRLFECRQGAPKDHWEHSEPKRLLGDWIGWGPSSTTYGWRSSKGRWIIDLGNMMGISYSMKEAKIYGATCWHIWTFVVENEEILFEVSKPNMLFTFLLMEQKVYLESENKKKMDTLVALLPVMG